MVRRVQDMYARSGRRATFKAISDTSTAAFHDRDLYAFVYDMNGTCLAHGARPALIGKNLDRSQGQDGIYLIRAIIGVGAGPGSGLVNYKWPNPLNNKIEDKTT